MVSGSCGVNRVHSLVGPTPSWEKRPSSVTSFLLSSSFIHSFIHSFVRLFRVLFVVDVLKALRAARAGGGVGAVGREELQVGWVGLPPGGHEVAHTVQRRSRRPGIVVKRKENCGQMEERKDAKLCKRQG